MTTLHLSLRILSKFYNAAAALTVSCSNPPCISMNTDTLVQILTFIHLTGYKSNKCGASAAEATSQATEELFTLLIQMGFVDQDSLHHKPELATRPPGN